MKKSENLVNCAIERASPVDHLIGTKGLRSSTKAIILCRRVSKARPGNVNADHGSAHPSLQLTNLIRTKHRDPVTVLLRAEIIEGGRVPLLPMAKRTNQLSSLNGSVKAFIGYKMIIDMINLAWSR